MYVVNGKFETRFNISKIQINIILDIFFVKYLNSLTWVSLDWTISISGSLYVDAIIIIVH